ncbi:MAG: septum formation initiator family protein [bacterium]
MVANFSKKRKGSFYSSKLLLPALAVLLAAIVISLVLVNLNMYKKRKELVSQISSYQKQIESVKKSNQELKNKIENTDNVEYLEKIAYEQLGEQKPGEKAVIFVTPEEKPKEVAKPESVWTSWFAGVWNWIKNIF